MPVSEMQAPLLSTHQDESTFSYAKVTRTELVRSHLDLLPGENYTQKLYEYYSLEELIRFLEQKTVDESGKALPVYKRVTLQFPDSLICDSASIVHELQKRLGVVAAGDDSGCAGSCNETACCKTKETPPDLDTQKLWILADTSYSACCVDEVAAEHVNADVVVHFGDACLNPVAKLASVYVFGRPQLDLDALEQAFRERYPDSDGKTIVLMADAPYTHTLHALAERVPEYKTVVADLVLSGDNTFSIGYTPQSSSGLRAHNRVLRGVVSDDEEQPDSVLSEYDLFHVTVPHTPRLLQLTTKFELVTTYDPQLKETSQGPFPNLMRRYRYMHMARAAGTIGILVNTLSLANTKTLINKIGQRIKSQGKKHYLFVVGKPNVAKLANFDSVDLWCVLGCDNQGIILDQYNEYFRPIVTPYELLLAIGDELSWTGKWVTDFNQVLHMMKDDVSDESEKEVDSEDEAPEFNPVTGQYVSLARPLRRLRHLQIGQEEEQAEGSETALVQRLSGTIALKGTVSTSAAHLQTREWTGLGSDWAGDEEEGAAVEEGTAGIARGYDFDVSAQ